MRWRGERGSATIEAVIVLPAFGLFVALIILAGRLAITQQTVAAAAAEAARSATLARTADDAQARARHAASVLLTSENTGCAGIEITVDTSGFSRPIGAAADVTVSVSCHVPLGDLTLPGVPGEKVVTSIASSPLDPFRGR